MIDIVFWIFLVVVIFTDIRYKKIYNCSTFTVAFFGIFYNTFLQGVSGLTNSLIGLVVGLALLGWVYKLGGCGGGDVKFVGAVGALMGYEFVVMGSIWGFILAGIIVSFLLIIKKQFKSTWGNTLEFLKLFFLTGFKQMSRNPMNVDLPYGVFLSFGMMAYKLWGG